MKQLLEPLRAVNSSAQAEKTRTREDRKSGEERQVLEAIHPVVRTHPETGRKALYVSGGHTARFVGMTEEESAGLLNHLFMHQVRPEFTCRFRWEPGSIAFWDNRCALHNPVNDYHGYRRIMHRVTLAGDVPR
jgi:taurine dioxygenase